MRLITIVKLSLTLLLSACKYGPFVKYYLPSHKTHLARFTKWEKKVGSDSNPLVSSYDITCYDWFVETFPKSKAIRATMKIDFTMLTMQDSIQLDLQKQMHIDTVIGSVTIKKIKRKKDVLFICFQRNLQEGEKITLRIAYHGKPIKLAGNSAINWKEDEQKKTWISTATQGIGPHHIMPCKNFLYDEPDSCFIHIKAPSELVAVANGQLDSVSSINDGKIYHWSVKNPINIYNLSFNIGDYDLIEKPYTDIQGVSRKILIYPLKYNKVRADTFYNQAPIILHKLERLYGAFPWWRDGCKVVESCLPNGTCMEHQSAISMSNAYQQLHKKINYTLVHELSHEWWGNHVTAYDYADLWLHEGFASYSEACFAEAIGDNDYFNDYINYFATVTKNKRPVMKTYGVAYNNLVHPYDQDIYNKGALFLHTLRMQLEDDALFFEILRDVQVRLAKRTLTSQQFLEIFNAATHRDFTPFFDVYLKQIKPPVLQFHIDKSRSDSSTITYRWVNPMPKDFNMKVMLDWGDTQNVIYPTSELQKILVPGNQKGQMDIVKFGYVLFKALKL